MCQWIICIVFYLVLQESFQNCGSTLLIAKNSGMTSTISMQVQKQFTFVFFIARYIGTHVSTFDKRILSIKLPDNIARTPRSITQQNYWKGETFL